MAGYPRKTQVVFASTGNVGTDGFGAAANGNIATEMASSSDIATLQTGTAGAWGGGWLTAVLGASKFPALEDMNAVFYVITSQLAYLFERGMAEYDAGTTYNTGDICKGVGTSQVYKSIVDSNTGQSLGNGSYWLLCGDLTSLSAGNIPVPAEQSVTGTNHTFASGDNGLFTKRSNGGLAMSDTLPGTTGALSNGWFSIMQNADATAINVIGVGSGGTINQGNLTGNIIAFPGETWMIYSQGSGTYNAYRIAPALLHANPVAGSSKNFKSIVTSTTAATLSADEIVLEDANGNARRVTTVSQAYATGTSGAGGLDTGSIAASTWYYEYLIFNPSTNTVKAMISLSATAPTLPSGYTFYKCTGEVRTDASSHLIGKQQQGAVVDYLVGVNLSGARTVISGSSGNISTPTYTAASVSNFVPPTASRIRGMLSQTGATSGTALAAPNSSYGPTESTTNTPAIQLCSLTSTPPFTVPFDWILQSTNVYYASDNSGGLLSCSGWVTSLMGT